jgi:hypothetical protein
MLFMKCLHIIEKHVSKLLRITHTNRKWIPKVYLLCNEHAI